MKKLIVVLALGIAASCSNSANTYATQDSLAAVDSTNNAKKITVDSAASAQKSNIDSMQQGAGMDTTGTKKDTTR